MKAKRLQLMTALLTAVMMVALSLNVMAAKSNAVTKDGLTVQLFTDKDSYKSGESVKASIQVDNHTGTDILIYANIDVPKGVTLASESAAFDAILKNGERWITQGGVLFTPTSVSGSSIATGDSMLVGFWIVLTALAVCGILVLFVYGKNRTTWLSIMLCLAMIGGMVVAAVPAEAAGISGKIPLSCTIQVDGKEAEVSATVSYVFYEEIEEAEEFVTTEAPEVTVSPTPTEVATVTPTTEPAEEPTATPAPTPVDVLETLFETDFEHETVDKVPTKGSKINQWTKINEATAEKKFVRVEDKNGNKVLHIYVGTDGVKGGPRAVRTISIKDRDNLIVEFKVQTDQATAVLHQYISGQMVLWAGQSDEVWTNIKLVMDLTNKTYLTFVDGVQSGEATALEIPEGTEDIEFRFSGGTLKPGTGVYFDDVKIGTEVLVDVDQILTPNDTVNWDNVKPTEALSDESFVNNMIDHPRIFVSAWNEIIDKINTIPEAARWYSNLKLAADNYLVPGAPERVVNSRGNVLESARAGRDHLQALAFVYKVEKQKGTIDADKYLEEAYAEMIEMGAWEDWSGFKSYLVTAELMFGYACAYDWLYDDLTEVQRTEIFEIVREKALTALVYNYEGVATSTNFTTHHNNWNPLCNGSAISAAFAFADEQPEIAEYILERGPRFIVNCLEPYAPEGAYPEGVSYWDLGTTYLIFAMDMLEHGFVEGFEIPEEYIYYNEPGIAQTCDFPIYYTGTTGRFNYGDCVSGMSNSVAFYWMANKFHKPQYAWYENKVQKDTNDYLSGYDAIAAICFYDPENANVNPDFFALDKFYQSDQDVNGISLRSDWEDEDALFAAMQGGNNKENHQHLSLGTYVIDYHGERFVKQLGKYDYALKGDKNQIYYKRAEASNTLVINPTIAAEQELTGYANLIKSGTSDNTAFGILDMSTAYTAGDATIISAKRGMMLTDNRNRVVVQDEVVLDEQAEFYWYANTDAGAKIAADGKSAILTLNNENMLVRIIEGPESAVISEVEAKSAIEGVKNDICGEKKLAIHVTGVSTLNLAVEYVGLEEGEGIPAAGAYVPLDSWKADDNDSEIGEDLEIIVKIDGETLDFFEIDREQYVLDYASDVTATPTVTVEAVGADNTSVTQAAVVGTYGVIAADSNNDGIADDTAVVMVTKDSKTYTYYIKMQHDPFEGILSITDPGVLNALKATLGDMEVPSEITYIYVDDLEDSTGWATYPERGIVDGVINNEILNRWASDAADSWIMMDFGESHPLYSMAFAGVTQESRQYLFDVWVSATGNENDWTQVHTGGAPMTTDIMSVIELYDNATAEQKAALENVRYVKLLGQGHIRTNGNKYAWNTWAEIRFYESDTQEKTDISYWPVYFPSGKFEGKAGAEEQIKLKGIDYYRTEFDLRENAEIIYEVADESIAKVTTESGVDKLEFLKNGTTTITITATQDGFSASTTVTVICEGSVDATKYTIHFVDHEEKALSGETYNLELTNGSVIMAPEGPEREADATYSYNFKGWQLKGATEGNQLIQKGEEITVTSTASYVAVYEAIERVYTVKFTLENGTILDTVTCKLNDNVTLPESLEVIDRDNKIYTQYTITNWAVGEGSENPGTDVTVTTDVTYIAKDDAYNKVDNTLLFYTDGTEEGITLNTNITNGQAGWSGVAVNAQKQLEAQYVKELDNEDNIVLYASQNAAYMGAESGQPSVYKTINVSEVSKICVEFDALTNGMEEASAKVVTKIRATVSGENKDTALWSKSTNGWQHVKIELDFYNLKANIYVDGESNGTVTLSLGKLADSLKFYFGSAPAGAGTGAYYDNILIYVPPMVTINFVDDDDQSINGYPQTVAVNTEITMPIGVEKADDADYTYTFVGWKMYTDGVVAGEAIAAEEKVTVAQNVIYKATYAKTEKEPESSTYTIQFADYNGNLLSGDNYTLILDKDAVINAPVGPKREDSIDVEKATITKYAFVGWMNGEELLDSGTTIATADVTYKAIYKEMTSTLLFYADGRGTVGSTPSWNKTSPGLTQFSGVTQATGTTDDGKTKNVTVKIVKDSETNNQFIQMYGEETHTAGNSNPRVTRGGIDLSNINTLTIETKVMTTGNGTAYINVNDGSNHNMWTSSSAGNWTDVKIILNLNKEKKQWYSTAYVNGVTVEDYTNVVITSGATESETSKIVEVRFNGKINKGDSVRYDDIKIYVPISNN